MLYLGLDFNEVLFPEGLIDNKSALVQVMAWHLAGYNSLHSAVYT